MLSIPYPVNCRQQFLFPNCVPNAGWHHVFDGLVKWGGGLPTIDWFTQFLAALKAWIKLFWKYGSDIRELFDATGFKAAAQLVMLITFTAFTELR